MIGFDFVPRSPLNSVQMPAKAVSGLSSFSANHTTSFFLVSGFGSGAYSAKLLNGTRQRFSGLSQPRQCGEVVLRMLVTGRPPARGGGGMPQRIIASSRFRRMRHAGVKLGNGHFSKVLSCFSHQ